MAISDLAHEVRKAAGDSDKTAVWISAHPEAKFKDVTSIMKAIRKAGISRISIVNPVDR